MRYVDNQAFYGPERIENRDRDTCAHWIGFQSDVIYRSCVFDARAAAEAVKITHSNNITLEDCDLYSGYEDCLDVVASSMIKTLGCRFHLRGRGRVAVTVKGGVKHYESAHCEVFGRPRHWTVYDIGGHTIYDADGGDYTSEIHISDNVVHERTLSLVRSWKARDIRISSNRGKYLLDHLDLPYPVWASYFWLRNKKVI